MRGREGSSEAAGWSDQSLDLAQKVRARGARRERTPDGEELGAHAVHVAHQIVAGDVGERGGELDDDVSVRDAHEVVERRHPVLFDRPGDAYVVEARVLQVVRVADADDVGEGVRPPRAVVVPGISRGGRA